MSKIVWDATGEHFYETGVKNGVLYPQNNDGTYPKGVAWNGLTNVTESPSGAEATPMYADDIKYLNLYSAEEFGATVECYTYPEEFAQCNGESELADGVTIGQQSRKAFGLCYKTTLGNDIVGNDYGYKLHLIYGAMASPSEKSYGTINDSPEAITFSYTVNTTPVAVDGAKPTSTIVIDSSKVSDADKLKAIEGILYGADAFSESSTYKVGDVVTNTNKTYQCKTAVTEAGAFSESSWTLISNSSDPRLPLPGEIKTLMAAG